MSIQLNTKYLDDYITKEEQNSQVVWKNAESAFNKIINKTGEGNNSLGWVNLPEDYDKAEFARIKAAAEKIKKQSEAVVVVGIGGSYLGARAAIDFIKSPRYNNIKKGTPDIYFLGNSISSDELEEVLALCENQDLSVIIISKSGTTTEPGIAFRILRGILEEKYGETEAAERIYIITDKNSEKSKLKAIAEAKGYETFIIPNDIGGRYSVLTPCGLLPIAVSGADIDKIIEGAKEARKNYLNFNKDNACIKYAVMRNILHKKGKSVEILASYEPAFAMMNEWWKQLFGESEGKNKKGIYPSSVIFSTDLHSLGQFIQDGSRIMFETVINIKEQRDKNNPVKIPADTSEKNDGMSYIDGAVLNEVNYKAMMATVIAHIDGGTPNMIIDIDKRDERTFGEIVYFFELACAVSGYILGVNPFDQPGVEAYKNNMFALLGNPKYAQNKEILEKRL